MARRKKTRHMPPGDAARPGAARPLPLRLVSRLPVIGAFVVEHAVPLPPPSRSQRLRQRLRAALRRERAEPVPARRRLPLVSPVLRSVRAPLERTASVVKVAREVRTPRTRWERLRAAAREVIDDPVLATRWERLMGLGVALAAGGAPAPAPRRSVIARVMQKKSRPVAQAPKAGLQARLSRLREVLNENAGPGQGRGRRGSSSRR